MKNEFTLTIYSEEQISLINKITTMFLRKKVNILSLNISVSEIENMYRHTIVVNETKEVVVNLAANIEKIIEVFKCYYSLNEETVFCQTALFKIPTDVFMTDSKMDFLLRKYDLKISEIQKNFTTIQATGSEKEINDLIEIFNSLGLVEYVKSSRVSLIKSSQGFYEDFLKM